MVGTSNLGSWNGHWVNGQSCSLLKWHQLVAFYVIFRHKKICWLDTSHEKSCLIPQNVPVRNCWFNAMIIKKMLLWLHWKTQNIRLVVIHPMKYIPLNQLFPMKYIPVTSHYISRMKAITNVYDSTRKCRCKDWVQRRLGHGQIPGLFPVAGVILFAALFCGHTHGCSVLWPEPVVIGWGKPKEYAAKSNQSVSVLWTVLHFFDNVPGSSRVCANTRWKVWLGISVARNRDAALGGPRQKQLSLGADNIESLL